MIPLLETWKWALAEFFQFVGNFFGRSSYGWIFVVEQSGQDDEVWCVGADSNLRRELLSNMLMPAARNTSESSDRLRTEKDGKSIEVTPAVSVFRLRVVQRKLKSMTTTGTANLTAG